jgi:hypothetical protein
MAAADQHVRGGAFERSFACIGQPMARHMQRPTQLTQLNPWRPLRSGLESSAEAVAADPRDEVEPPQARAPAQY